MTERASFHARVMALPKWAFSPEANLWHPDKRGPMVEQSSAAEIASEADALIAEHETRERFMLAATRDAQEFAAHYGDVMTQRGQEIERLKAKADALAEAAQGLRASLQVAVDSDLGALWLWPETARQTWTQNASAALAAYAKAAGESA